MNHLVILEAGAGELEKILSRVKSMILREIDPAQAAGQLVSVGDSLYFLRDSDEYALRVKATVVRVLTFTNNMEENLSHILKEMQPRLQFSENQYNYWSAKKQVLLVEFDDAQKIDMIHVEPYMVTDRSDWIAFEEFGLITR
jgi:hypothetical protein